MNKKKILFFADFSQVATLGNFVDFCLGQDYGSFCKLWTIFQTWTGQKL